MENTRLAKIRRDARQVLGSERSDLLGDDGMGAVVGAVIHSISPGMGQSALESREGSDDLSAFEKAVVDALSHLSQARNQAIARGMPSRERLREMIDQDEDLEVEAGSFEALATLLGGPSATRTHEDPFADLRDPSADPAVVERDGAWYVTGPQWSGPWFSEECAELAKDGEFTFAHDENVRAHAVRNGARNWTR